MKPVLDGVSFEKRVQLEAQIPQLAALRTQYAALCQRCAEAAALSSGFEEADAQRQAFLETMDRTQRMLLRQHGIDPDHMDTGYACNLCQDVGYQIVQGAKRTCSCQIQKRLQRRNRRATPLPSFADFNPAIFPTEDQRDSAEHLAGELLAYANAFPHTGRKHFILFGAAGLGKTFLLGCTTQAIRARGFTVQHVTGYRLLEMFRAQHIGEKDCMADLIAIPFLAIDDLGTEPIYRNITIEYLNLLLDERMRIGHHTAIATNLAFSEVATRYGERIASRLFDSTQCRVFGLRGQDLRRCT